MSSPLFTPAMLALDASPDPRKQRHRLRPLLDAMTGRRMHVQVLVRSPQGSRYVTRTVHADVKRLLSAIPDALTEAGPDATHVWFERL